MKRSSLLDSEGKFSSWDWITIFLCNFIQSFSRVVCFIIKNLFSLPRNRLTYKKWVNLIDNFLKQQIPGFNIIKIIYSKFMNLL
jgi:hypothetical protein